MIMFTLRRLVLLTPVLLLSLVASCVLSIGENNASRDNICPPRTRAELTDYRETSTYKEVMKFITDLQAGGAPISLQYIGTSTHGHRIPLVIASNSKITSPLDAHKAGKIVVYLQANVHGGEVEGKEAALMLLRDLSENPGDNLLDKIVLLVTPIYNIDGNEALGPWRKNRHNQSSPAVVGRRANGQGLDLNRDAMKVESPEMAGALKHIFTKWDPEVFIDLHATNGTRHGYQLTYAGPLHPDTQTQLADFVRDELLGSVQNRLRREHGVETFLYGNVRSVENQKKWYPSPPDARMVTNNIGLRNRISILSEAACFLPFKQRVEVTEHFVRTMLEEVTRRKNNIVELVHYADARIVRWGQEPRTAPAMTIRYEIDSVGPGEIILEKAGAAEHSQNNSQQIIPPTDFTTVTMPVYDRYRPTRTSRFPAAYIIPVDCGNVIELLQLHGITVEKLTRDWKGAAEEFVIEQITDAARPYQGHVCKELKGRFVQAQAVMPMGSYVVKTAQPLGLVVFHLLEPEALDGVAAWNFLDSLLESGQPYPIIKCYDSTTIPSKTIL